MPEGSILELAKACREAAPDLAILSAKKKNQVLTDMARAIRREARQIISENGRDLEEAARQVLLAAMQDRLLLNEKRIEEMARGLIGVAKLPDPVGEVTKRWRRPNGLRVSRVRIPLGVIGVIYESRPNVTVDAAALCFKSGNAVILRGGSEAFHSNQLLGAILRSVLAKHHLPEALITVVPSTDRAVLNHMLTLTQYIDVLIPRGGEGLMRFMVEHSKIPVIKHDKGVCNLYVDDRADLEMALSLIDNAKTQRPGVCNALENLLVHRKIAAKFLPRLNQLLTNKGVELRGDAEARCVVPTMTPATEVDWDTEYLDLILAVATVKNFDEAIDWIRRHGSQHTEAIVTRDKKRARDFVRSLDSSCIMVNASTRFNDGGQLGLGAEIGISTTKLHAFGPMGLEELTTTKFVVEGRGHVRA